MSNSHCLHCDFCDGCDEHDDAEKIINIIMQTIKSRKVKGPCLI